MNLQWGENISSLHNGKGLLCLKVKLLATLAISGYTLSAPYTGDTSTIAAVTVVGVATISHPKIGILYLGSGNKTQ